MPPGRLPRRRLPARLSFLYAIATAPPGRLPPGRAGRLTASMCGYTFSRRATCESPLCGRRPWRDANKDTPAIEDKQVCVPALGAFEPGRMAHSQGSRSDRRRHRLERYLSPARQASPAGRCVSRPPLPAESSPLFCGICTSTGRILPPDPLWSKGTRPRERYVD